MTLDLFVKKLLAYPYSSKLEPYFFKLKREFAKEHGKLPKNSDLISSYSKLLKLKKIRQNKTIENLLRIRKIRSLSGIVPVAVLTKEYPCPGNCIYCPTQKGMPKSYLDDEPAVMRANAVNFDPYLQVKRRLNQLKHTGHTTDKIELIVMGGTFSFLPKDYQEEFIKRCFEAANGLSSETLPQAQKINEKAKQRIIGLTLETRPDQINLKEIKRMRYLGATRVEIGVQSIYNKVLKQVDRGHAVKHTIYATRLLKDAGFKVCYHLMPNLPGSTIKMDLKMFKEIFSNPDFMPDMIKIYPCVVLYQAKLFDWYRTGKFKPYTDRELIDLLLKIKKITPPWIRINRLGRDIPSRNIAAGNKLSNIRQILQDWMKENNQHCRCIRCREIRSGKVNLKDLKLTVEEYQAGGGREYFLQYTDENQKLYAMLRLRIPDKFLLDALNDCAIIRELHTYGQALSLSESDPKVSQHRGLGKMLLKKAEEIAIKNNLTKIAVISGVGVRSYYGQLGFMLKDFYMIKRIL